MDIGALLRCPTENFEAKVSTGFRIFCIACTYDGLFYYIYCKCSEIENSNSKIYICVITCSLTCSLLFSSFYIGCWLVVFPSSFLLDNLDVYGVRYGLSTSHYR